MPVLLLTYELVREHDPEFDYYKFFNVRDTYQPVKLTEGAYALVTAETSSEVRHKLQKHLHRDDNLFVFVLDKPYSGRGLKKTVDWLDEHLPQ